MSETKDLLFEIGTEELPTKSLKKIAIMLVENVKKSLDEIRILYQASDYFVSPRRIAFILYNLEIFCRYKSVVRAGPFLDKVYDKNGLPTLAALGFSRSCGVSFGQLDIIEHKNGKRLFYRYVENGDIRSN